MLYVHLLNQSSHKPGHVQIIPIADKKTAPENAAKRPERAPASSALSLTQTARRKESEQETPGAAKTRTVFQDKDRSGWNQRKDSTGPLHLSRGKVHRGLPFLHVLT